MQCKKAEVIYNLIIDALIIDGLIIENHVITHPRKNIAANVSVKIGQ